MAKINAHGLNQVGPTFFTERVRKMPRSGASDVDTVFVEAWRLRSDGVLQTRILRTREKDVTNRIVEHRGSTFRNVGTFKPYDRKTTNSRQAKDMLQTWLERKGFTITKETYR